VRIAYTVQAKAKQEKDDFALDREPKYKRRRTNSAHGAREMLVFGGGFEDLPPAAPEMGRR